MRKLAFLTTTFPLLTETFVQREVRQYLKKGEPFDIYSIWKGEKEFEGYPVQKFPLLHLLKLLYWLPFWMIVKPEKLLCILQPFMVRGCRYFQNWEENLLGIAFGLIYAKKLEKQNINKIHAIWATMPVAAALTINRLTGIPYTAEAHAYDLFREGGDVLLDIKFKYATKIRTSNHSAYKKILAILPNEKNKISLIRRGLTDLPEFKNTFTKSLPLKPLQILSVGRLTEKKGYFEQLKIYHALKSANVDFQATIIGGGELEKDLRTMLQALNLNDRVRILGAQPFEVVEQYYKRSTLFVFTGKVARSGDRDGFPNVLGEAMARGLIIISSNVSDVSAAIIDKKTGYICDINNTRQWVDIVRSIAIPENRNANESLLKSARNWVETNFVSDKNANRVWTQIISNL